jgi:hypothetical protein
MTPKNILRPLLTGLVAALFLTACDFSEQNIDWEPGTSLAVVGPITAGGAALDDDAVTAGVQLVRPATGSRTVYFYVRGFNSDRTYTWTANGQSLPSLQGGEFTEFVLQPTTALGAYTVQVNNGTYVGSSVQFTVTPPAN